MSSTHFIYIPIVLLVGIALGYALAQRAAMANDSAAERRLRARQERLQRLKAELAERRMVDDDEDDDEKGA